MPSSTETVNVSILHSERKRSMTNAVPLVVAFLFYWDYILRKKCIRSRKEVQFFYDDVGLEFVELRLLDVAQTHMMYLSYVGM